MQYALLTVLFIFGTIEFQEKKKPEPKPDPSLARVEDVAGLPRVLIIGDSISMGYTLPVRKLLKDKANVHRISENGGPTTNGIAKFEKWLTVNGSRQWDVIHFNWGLHDLKVTSNGHQVSPEDYEKNLRQLVKQLKATGARLICATTTPVPEGKLSPLRKSEDVQKYNVIAQKIMTEEGVVINDLYTACLPELKNWQRPVNVHFTDNGSQALAEIVAGKIANELKRKP